MFVGGQMCAINEPLASRDEIYRFRLLKDQKKGTCPMVLTKISLNLWAQHGHEMGTNWAQKRNAHMKWAFATSLDGMDVGCAGKI